MDLLPYEVLMETLRRRRKELQLTQRAVAEEADISYSMLNRMEKHNQDANYRTVYRVWEVINNAQQREMATAQDLMNSPIEYAHSGETHESVAERMQELAVSQLPVENDGEIVGHISERLLMDNDDHSVTVDELMDEPLMSVPHTTGRDALRAIFFDGNSAVVVTEKGEPVGIVTPADLI